MRYYDEARSIRVIEEFSRSVEALRKSIDEAIPVIQAYVETFKANEVFISRESLTLFDFDRDVQPVPQPGDLDYVPISKEEDC